MQLPDASSEQTEIIADLEKSNLIVDAVAGSGKTTTVLHIATKIKKSILLLTYNKKLKMETRNKKKKLGLTNLEVHSYHSFCVKYYNPNCYTDREIINLLKKHNVIESFAYEYIILDEAQDITTLYYRLVHRIIKDNKQVPKLCIFGDRYQSIYDFNGADARFITLGEQLFKQVNNYQWTNTKLPVSYRLTDQMGKFLNNVVLGQDRIRTVKKSKFKVRYLICDYFGNLGLNGKDKVFDEIMYYLKHYAKEDIFVLAPSVKSERCPPRQLANKLSQHGVSIYVPNNDEEKLDEDILRGKLVFSTFHQAKGMERKVVVVFGFDSSYFQLFKKDKNPQICPNELYVATTRASDRLTVLHHYQNDFLEFLDIKALKSCCEFKEIGIKLQNTIKNKPLDTAVTDLVKHMKSSVLEKAGEYFDVVKIHEKEEIIDLAAKIQQSNGLFESVSEITGVAIPSYLELRNKGTMTIYNQLRKAGNCETNNNGYLYMFGDLGNLEDSEEYSLDKITVNIDSLKPDELLFISNNYCAYRSGYIYKLLQIKNYGWLSQENLNKCVTRLEKYISKDALFEKRLEIEKQAELYNRKLIGNVDCIDNSVLYEFKCVNELGSEHFIQLAIYYYIYEMNKDIFKQQYVDKHVHGRRTRELLPLKNDEVTISEEKKYINGIITTIYKNGRINVKRDNGKVIKSSLSEIVENLTIVTEMRTIDEMFKFKYCLYNILTNEMFEIKSTLDRLREMIGFLIYNKYMVDNKSDDATFLKDMLNSVK